MTSAKHTPLPWLVGQENVGGGFNIYSGALRVAHTSIQARVVSPETRLIDEEEAKANALLIVEAVNAYLQTRAPNEPLRCPNEWLGHPDYRGISVVDPDGWDRKNFDASWAEQISKEEFDRRLMNSTCTVR